MVFFFFPTEGNNSSPLWEMKPAGKISLQVSVSAQGRSPLVSGAAASFGLADGTLQLHAGAVRELLLPLQADAFLRHGVEKKPDVLPAL